MGCDGHVGVATVRRGFLKDSDTRAEIAVPGPPPC